MNSTQDTELKVKSRSREVLGQLTFSTKTNLQIKGLFQARAYPSLTITVDGTTSDSDNCRLLILLFRRLDFTSVPEAVTNLESALTVT